MKPVTLTRKVAFSSGHRYWFPHLSESENRQIFGVLASRFNHGHNYVLYCSIRGEVDPATGMVINIKTLDAALQETVVAMFDQKSINDEVEEFSHVAPCLENLLLDMARIVKLALPGVHVAHLKLEEMPGFFAEMDLESQKMTLTRSYEFAAAHRLHLADLSEEENFELFGKCTNPAGHGHNYVLEVAVSGVPDPVTGFLLDIGELDKAVEERVIARYDHKNLNIDVPELLGKNPTSEVVALAIWEQLEGAVPGTFDRVRLLETDRNIFEVSRG